MSNNNKVVQNSTTTKSLINDSFTPPQAIIKSFVPPKASVTQNQSNIIQKPVPSQNTTNKK